MIFRTPRQEKNKIKDPNYRFFLIRHIPSPHQFRLSQFILFIFLIISTLLFLLSFWSKERGLSFSILLFKGFLLFGFHIFQFKNAPTPLCLSRDKIKGHSGKNTTLTPTKTLPKKQDYFSVIFQITLSTYKLDSLFKKKKNS